MAKVITAIVATDIRGYFIPAYRLMHMLPDIEEYVKRIVGDHSRIMTGKTYDVRPNGGYARMLVIGDSEQSISASNKKAAKFNTLSDALEDNYSEFYFVSTCDKLLKQAAKEATYTLVIRLNEVYDAFKEHFVLADDVWTRIMLQGRYSSVKDISYHIVAYKKTNCDDVLTADFWRAQTSAQIARYMKAHKGTEDERDEYNTDIDSNKYEKSNHSEVSGAKTVFHKRDSRVRTPTGAKR